MHYFVKYGLIVAQLRCCGGVDSLHGNVFCGMIAWTEGSSLAALKHNEAQESSFGVGTSCILFQVIV